MTKFFLSLMKITGNALVLFLSTCAIVNAGPYLNVKPILPAIHYAQEAEKKHGIPENLLTAIAHVESKCTPYAVNAKGRGHYFSSKEQAAKFIHELRAQGVRNINVGYMQLNLPSHVGRFKSVDDMLDIKRNIDFAAALLSKLHRIYGSWERAVERYKSSFCSASKSYQQKIYSIRASLKLPKAAAPAVTLRTEKSAQHHFTAHYGSLHYISHKIKIMMPSKPITEVKSTHVQNSKKHTLKTLALTTLSHFTREGTVTNLAAWDKTYYFPNTLAKTALIEETSSIASKATIVLGVSSFFGRHFFELQIL